VQASGPDHQKDTLRNVTETSAFTVNIVGANQVQAMNVSSGDYPYGENEFTTAGLRMIPGTTVNVPHVGEVPAALECTLLQTITLPANDRGGHYTAILGTVTGIFVDQSVIVDGKISYALLAPVARMGYRDYANINDFFELGRPVIKG
jgi:flavin reductase (DIM6/NTAB) family NADH-FMN oxidoreductase RutF